MAYRTVHALALQFTGSATPPEVHLTSFYVEVLPGLPPRGNEKFYQAFHREGMGSFTRPSTGQAVIEGLGMRLRSSSCFLCEFCLSFF